MKAVTVLIACVLALAQLTDGAFVPPTLAPKTTATISQAHQVAPTGLHKREAEPRKVVINKQILKDEEAAKKSEEPPKPWIRTIYDDVVEVVTPYVIGGVTFAAPQPQTTNGLEPWISINKEGLPKTITPKLKNGIIANGYPDVKTYYQTATTVVHHQKDLKAHNLGDDETVEEVIMIEEDDTYVKLSPLQRCTPDYYYKKGVANVESSEPFCAPEERRKFRVGLTYFITWYTRFFENTNKVRFHYAYVNEKSHEKGFDKRDFLDAALKDMDTEIERVAGEVATGGAVHGAFYSSDWIDNTNGWYSFEVKPEWLQEKFYKKVAIAIQPDSIPDDEFSILDAPHIFATFQYKESIGKNTKEMRALQDKVGTNDDVYYVIAAMPTVVLISVIGMYGFLYLTRKHRDLSGVRKPKRSRFGNQGKYNIPLAMTDLHKPDKQS